MLLKELQVGKYFRRTDDPEGKAWRKSYPTASTPEDIDEVTSTDGPKNDHYQEVRLFWMARNSQVIELRQVISYEVM